MLTWLTLFLACTGDDAGTCDDETQICDTGAWAEQGLAEQVLDPPEGTWLDIVRLPGCVGGGRWTFSARAGGHGHPENLANVWISGDSPFSEEHVLNVAASSDNGLLHELQLKAGTDLTALVCGVHDVEPVLTATFRIYDEDGALSDCGIVSTEDDYLGAIDQVLTGQATETAMVTRPDELASCQPWLLPTQ